MRYIGKLLNAISETGLDDDTFIMFMSDHGEEMYEHGIFFDHHGLYDANIHTPLIAKLPNSQMVSL